MSTKVAYLEDMVKDLAYAGQDSKAEVPTIQSNQPMIGVPSPTIEIASGILDFSYLELKRAAKQMVRLSAADLATLLKFSHPDRSINIDSSVFSHFYFSGCAELVGVFHVSMIIPVHETSDEDMLMQNSVYVGWDGKKLRAY